MAPTFAEPYNRLAALRNRQGFAKEAHALQSEAVKHAPDNAIYAERLEAYRALAMMPPSDAARAEPDSCSSRPQTRASARLGASCARKLLRM